MQYYFLELYLLIIIYDYEILNQLIHRMHDHLDDILPLMTELLLYLPSFALTIILIALLCC